MQQIKRNEQINTGNPKLKISMYSGTTPIVPTELWFTIYEINSPEKVITPIKIFPESTDKEPVDIFASDKLVDGEYVATYTHPHSAGLGKYKIIWQYKLYVGQPTFNSFTEEFETIDYIEVYGSKGPPIVGIHDVRTFLRDYSQYHVLIDEQLFTDEEIMTAAEFIVDRFNLMNPPISTVTLSNFPSDYLLLVGICGWLFDSEANRQLSEQLTYQDGNIHHGLDDKHQLYQAAAVYYKNEFATLAYDIKMRVQNNGVYSGEGRGVRFLQSRSRMR